VPQLSRAIEAVIMKCLQKDVGKRYQSVDDLEIALVKAARAKPIPPWEVALNREVARVEVEIRNRLHTSLENMKGFLKRQDWSFLIGLQQEPKAMLGVAGLVGALTVFLFFGGWKPRTINAQTIQAAGQKSLPPAAAIDGSVSGYSSRPPQYSLTPIASNEIDLYADSRPENGKTISSDPGLPKHNLPSERATPPAASPKPAGIVKRAISPVRTNARKAHPDVQASTQLQTLASRTQPETLTEVSTPKSVAQESATNSSQPSAFPDMTHSQVITSSQQKTGGEETKTPKLYFEVGSFKDETWANNAVDKLTQLGFHAVLVHKNLLWTQSYHVEVGPYTNQKDIGEARQSLASQGFKAHPVN
jgi:cell division protein FtsN